MIKYRDKIFPAYFIDPVTAIITNSKGEIQETKINECGRPCFHCIAIHKIQVHTHLGYKKGFDIHHIDENKMNNSLSNLVYLTKSEHTKIHHKGKKLSSDIKTKIREALKGERNGMYGKHHSEEAKKKMSDMRKGENSYMYGKHMSEETKQKISDAKRGQKLSDETKKKISELISGENHPFYGKHHSEETKQKMSEKQKEKIWINNGVISKRVQCNEDIPEGFSRGRLKK